MLLFHRLQEKDHRPAIQVVRQYGDLPRVECYAGHLNQVFMSLLDNAIDALEPSQDSDVEASDTSNRPPPTIRICTEYLESGRVAIRIADNGHGMTKEIQQQLFDPFFTTRTVGQGVGLGLSVSYQIVTEQHQGQLRCVSAPKEGAEFTIEIPVQQKRADA